MRSVFPCLTIVAGVLGGGLVPAAAADISLASHQAAYAMSLDSARLSGGVTAASGAMTYQFRDACDGWTAENRTDLDFSYGSDPPVSTSWQFATWESKDGKSYRFWVRSTRDGEVDQMIDGDAHLSKDGSGVAHFTKPAEKSIALPKGTVFPTAHTILLLEAATQGIDHVGKVLFDGTDPTGPSYASAFIGRRQDGAGGVKPANDDLTSDLLSVPSWPMELAFYGIGAKQAEPDYELGLHYYLNGVADRVLQSFGDFAVAGTLEHLRSLPKPTC